MSAIKLDNTNFDTLINGEKLTVVDFWAEWCGPCKMLLPTIEALADEFDGAVNIGKLNVDEQSAISDRFDIQTVPTLLFFKNGEVVDKIVGARPKPALVAKINSLK